MSLVSNLEYKLYEKISQTGRECDLIVMHPKTWQDLFQEIIYSDRMEISKFDPILKYRGIRVLRSLDIQEGLFEVS